MLFRLLFAMVMLVPVVGCGGGSESSVLDQNVERDPSLGDEYYDQAKYDALINADPTPPE